MKELSKKVLGHFILNNFRFVYLFIIEKVKRIAKQALQMFSMNVYLNVIIIEREFYVSYGL
jgi:hypothetical protein